MSDVQKPKGSRRTAVVIVVVLVVVIAAVVVTAVLTSGVAAPRSTSSPSDGGATSAPASPSASTTQSPSPAPTVSRSASSTSTPTPQPTKTAAISSSAPITKSLTAAVTRMEAVQGTATGPGEIAGPAVRFTVRITNGTSKRISLSDTVINVYTGKDESPAVELSGPGGKDLPASVAAGSSATGVFVFNIPKSERSLVTVTVDTSTSNPVLAFTGSAP